MRWNEFGQPIGDPMPAGRPSERPIPDPDVLRGRQVRLERLTTQHAPDLFRHLGGPGREPLWTYLTVGPFASEGELTAYVVSLVADDGFVPLAIVDQHTDEAVGLASYLRIEPGAGTLEVGAIVYGAALARTAGATEAMYLMARHAVDDLGYRRYEWKCDSLNEPSRRAAHRLGFTFEGVWRQATTYKGRNRDTAWFGMTDGDWALLRPVVERWLAPENHRGGSQRERLSALTSAALPMRPVPTREIHPTSGRTSDNLT